MVLRICVACSTPMASQPDQAGPLNDTTTTSAVAPGKQDIWPRARRV
jgi:hypothetical protein